MTLIILESLRIINQEIVPSHWFVAMQLCGVATSSLSPGAPQTMATPDEVFISTI